MRNYIQLKSLSFLYNSYMYIDTTEHLANDIFIGNHVKVKIKFEMKKDHTSYILVFCKVRKTNEDLFLQCLDQLQYRMLFRGHYDYSEYCESFIEKFSQWKGTK